MIDIKFKMSRPDKWLTEAKLRNIRETPDKYLVVYDFWGANRIPRMLYYYRSKLLNKPEFRELQQSVVLCSGYTAAKEMAELVEKFGGEALIFKVIEKK